MKNLKKLACLLLAVLMLMSVMTACGKSADGEAKKDNDLVEISVLVGADTTIDGFEAVAAAAEEAIGVKVNIEQVPSNDLDNTVKTRCASGDMSDLLIYNSGALLKTLNPADNFVDISGEDFVKELDEAYVSSVTFDGATYGVPVGSSMVYGVLYNKAMYAEYNLEIPTTWQEFLDNCQVLKDAGEIAIVGSAKDQWTCQIVFLGDYYNLQNADPNFPASYEAGEQKWATNPQALRGWEKTEETAPYYNEDQLATTYDQACEMLAEGQAAHYFMLTNAVGNIASLYDLETANNIGAFPVLDDNGDNGVTLEITSSLYANKNSENKDAVLKFMDYYVSADACQIHSEAEMAAGPYFVKGFASTASQLGVVADLQVYFDEGKTAPALEFITSVKGEDCHIICQEVSIGSISALEGAEKYDLDCVKQAVQLGLDWSE